MRLIACWALLAVLPGFTVLANDGVVKLTQGKESIKATIDGEVFTVFRFSSDRQKPFFQPVVAPGSLDLLKKAAASTDPWEPGRKVFVAAEEAALKVEKSTGETVKYGEILEVGPIDGEWLWVPAKNAWIHRSDVAPVTAIVTRLINDNPSKTKDRGSPEYYDHVHHKGIWFSLDEVAETNYWAEGGRISNQSAEIVTPEGNPAVFKLVNHWENKNGGEPTLVESATVSIYANRLLTYDVVISSPSGDLTLNDTKEGMFAIRLPNSMRETFGGGPVTNSDGEQGTKASWGKTFRWIDYDGPVGGHQVGVTLMDDPKNPWKSRYHVRDYGLFAINPFGEGSYTAGKDEAKKKPVTIKKGESLQFRFGLWVHGDSVTPADVEKVYEQFVATHP